MMQLRHVRPSDCDRVLAVIDEWWGGPAMSSHLPHVFFSHLAPTSFVLEEDDGELVGFLLGFFSQARPDEACVHMVGVHPAFRRLGFGRRLCERFFLTAQMHGRRWVRSVSTSSGPSIAFHHALGFVPLRGDAVIDGLPVRRDHAGPGGQRVVFRRGIVHDAPAAEAGAAPIELGAAPGLKDALTS
jgi:GNAT superfamily N-acetyltransferase